MCIRDRQELIFTVYSQEEWDEWFEGGKKDYLTGAVLDELLKRLGVSEQIDFSEKRKNAAVSRTEWNQVYAPVSYTHLQMDIKKLAQESIAAKEFAYTPYSHFRVGAALLTKDGGIRCV